MEERPVLSSPRLKSRSQTSNFQEIDASSSSSEASNVKGKIYERNVYAWFLLL